MKLPLGRDGQMGGWLDEMGMALSRNLDGNTAAALDAQK